MKAIKKIRCETVADVIAALQQLPADLPIRQGFGDDCMVVQHAGVIAGVEDACVTFEEFDYAEDTQAGARQ